MKVLFIEDEQTKEKYICDLLRDFDNKVDITVEKSLMSGISRIQKESFDITLLDMSLPLYDIGSNIDEINEFEAFAGIDILEEMFRIDYTGKVIVITAFDIIEDDTKRLSLEQLNIQMKNDYPGLYMGCIHYNSSSLEWKRELEVKIREVGGRT